MGSICVKVNFIYQDGGLSMIADKIEFNKLLNRAIKDTNYGIVNFRNYVLEDLRNRAIRDMKAQGITSIETTINSSDINAYVQSYLFLRNKMDYTRN